MTPSTLAHEYVRMNLIEIRDLCVAFNGQTVVRNLSLDVRPGECLALVGESGSGKSVTAHSILQLLPQAGTQTLGSIKYRGQELIGASPSTLQKLRGNRIAMIFQEPMTSLNPLHSIEKQIGETLLLHKGLGGKAAQARILELLELVGIQKPQERLKAYPHQLSGGQRQRVMIAMALACEPRTADCRRAHHGARRDGAAQDPVAAQIFAATFGHVAAVDQPRSEPGAQYRPAGLRDARRGNRRAGRLPGPVHRTAASLQPPAAGRRALGAMCCAASRVRRYWKWMT